MRALLPVMVFILFIFLIAGAIAFFSNRSEDKRAGLKGAKKRAATLENTLDEIEQGCRDNLTVNVVDPTASYVLALISRARRELR